MGLLAGTLYDPSTAASGAVSSLQAMTALDTTNLRLTFTAPSNGAVRVVMRSNVSGATTSPSILLGVLDGATVRGRQVPHHGRFTAGATQYETVTASFLVTGLTAGQSYTWDAAVGVEFAVASSVLKWGGPNNSTASDAWGGFAFEIWDTPELLAGAMYDPSTAATIAISAGAAMTALDTSNLRLSFVCPSSGIVLVRLRGGAHGATSTGAVLLGVLDGATVRGRMSAAQGINEIGTIVSTDSVVYSTAFLVSGLTPGNSYTWDAARGVELAAPSGVLRWGGPDNSTQDDASGGFLFEILNPKYHIYDSGMVV
jgi:hypothetical protein